MFNIISQYNDNKDILADWALPICFGDSHNYLSITKHGENYYAKCNSKRFPYNELTHNNLGDYEPSKDDPYKFERID